MKRFMSAETFVMKHIIMTTGTAKHKLCTYIYFKSLKYTVCFTVDIMLFDE